MKEYEKSEKRVSGRRRLLAIVFAFEILNILFGIETRILEIFSKVKCASESTRIRHTFTDIFFYNKTVSHIVQFSSRHILMRLIYQAVKYFRYGMEIFLQKTRGNHDSAS